MIFRIIVTGKMRSLIKEMLTNGKLLYKKIDDIRVVDNTIGASLVPIDMLRLKLSFFGAIKFDPRSDKWLRISMFQGAPLPNELKKHDDQWVYNSLN